MVEWSNKLLERHTEYNQKTELRRVLKLYFETEPDPKLDTWRHHDSGCVLEAFFTVDMMTRHRLRSHCRLKCLFFHELNSTYHTVSDLLSSDSAHFHMWFLNVMPNRFLLMWRLCEWMWFFLPLSILTSLSHHYSSVVSCGGQSQIWRIAATHHLRGRGLQI